MHDNRPHESGIPDGRAGTALAAAGAFSYAVTIAVGRTLAKSHLGVETSLGIRFGIGGLILLLVLVALRRPLLPAPGERIGVILLGGLGYMIESSFFFMALERGSAAAVALLFYAYPAIVSVLQGFLGTRLPRHAVLALLLSAAGTALIVASGGDVTISRVGVLCALASAASFAIYLLAGDRVVKRTDSLTTGTWVALGASVSLLARGAVLGHLHDPSGHWLQLLGYGVATGSAFVLMFAALRRLGAGPTAIVMTLESLFAVVLAGVFLHEQLHLLQIVGGVAILAATVIIGLTQRAAADAPQPHV